MAVELAFVARNAQLRDSFREYAEERFEKIEQLTEGAQRAEVKLSSQTSHRGASGDITVELTLFGHGDVVRAEASDDDRQVAFDKAFHNLQERLRRLRERRKGNRRRISVQEFTADAVPVDPNTSLVEQVIEARKAEEAREEEERRLAETGEAPVTIRRKVFPADHVSIDDAIDNMELLGHDFYLFIDKDNGQPSVAYRRHGWSYGVITLSENGESTEEQARKYRENQA